MNNKKFSARATAWVLGAALIVILVAVGISSQRWFNTRFDLTENNQYTLSKVSVKTLESLPDLIVIKAVISKDLPTQFLQIRTQVEDLLHEFEARGKGKVRLTFEDPGENEQKRQQATALGIQEVQLQEQSRDGMQIKKGFFGLAITYGDKKEIIPVLQDLQSFEYDLVVKIKKLTGTSKTIGIIEGAEGNKMSFTVPGPNAQPIVGFDANFKSVKASAEKLYRFEKLDPTPSSIPDNIDVLLVAAPTRLGDMDKYAIDQFIMRGKSVIFLSPGVDVNLSYGISGVPSNNGYEDLLASYGLTVKKNALVEDQNFEFVAFNGNPFFLTPYPYWIKIHQDQLDSKNNITAKLPMLSLPWCSSIEIDSTKKAGSTIEILASTTKGSWEESGTFNLVPRDLKEYLPVAQKSQPVIVLKSGNFNSFYSDKPAPVDSTNKPDPTKFLKSTSSAAKILLIPNALFATDFYMEITRAGTNAAFMLNAFDQLALDPDLILIRSREMTNKPIPEDKRSAAGLLTWLNILVAPMVLLLAGIIVGIRRRNREA